MVRVNFKFTNYSPETASDPGLEPVIIAGRAKNLRKLSLEWIHGPYLILIRMEVGNQSHCVVEGPSSYQKKLTVCLLNA